MDKTLEKGNNDADECYLNPEHPLQRFNSAFNLIETFPLAFDGFVGSIKFSCQMLEIFFIGFPIQFRIHTIQADTELF